MRFEDAIYYTRIVKLHTYINDIPASLHLQSHCDVFNVSMAQFE